MGITKNKGWSRRRWEEHLIDIAMDDDGLIEAATDRMLNEGYDPDSENTDLQFYAIGIINYDDYREKPDILYKEKSTDAIYYWDKDSDKYLPFNIDLCRSHTVTWADIEEVHL